MENVLLTYTVQFYQF